MNEYEQLLLALRLPWDGVSPRLLTAAYLNSTFRAEGMGRLDQDASHVGDIEQESLPGGQRLFPFEEGVYNG